MKSPTLPRPANRSSVKYGSLVATLLAAIATATSAHAGDVIKGNSTTALNVTTSWVGGIAPAAADVAVWNNTVTATNAAGSPAITQLGGDLSWQGIRVGNVTGAVNTTTTNSGVQILNTSSNNTLTLGTDGINMSAATQALFIQSKIALTGNQTWAIANANTQNAPFAGSGVNSTLGEDLMFNALVVNTPMNLGGFTVSTSGNGSIGLSNGYTISNGTLSLANPNTWFQSGGSRKTVLNPTLTVNLAAGSNLRLRANSGGVESNAPINLTGNNSKLQLEINNGGVSLIQNGNISLGAGSTLENIVTESGAVTVAGGISTTGSNSWLVNGSKAPHPSGLAFSGSLTGNGTITYANTATGNLTGNFTQVRLSGDNSGFTGTLIINGGSGNRNIRLSSDVAGSASATWTVAAANTLQVDGWSVELGTLNGAGTVTNSHASFPSTISVGSGTFTGTITNGTPVEGMALTKIGSGTLALSGANTYTGLTDIQGGMLSVTTAQTGGGTISVADGATLLVNQASAGATFNTSTLNLGSSSGATLDVVPATSSTAAVVTAPTLNVNGTSTLKVSGSPVNGTILVDYTGTIGGAGFGGLSLVMPFRSSGTLFHDEADTKITLSNVQTDTLKWKGNVDANWDTTTSNWILASNSSAAQYTQTGVGQTDAPVFDDTAVGNTALTLNTSVTPIGVTFNNSSQTYSVSGSGSIGGAGSIVKNGSGALTLATANTFTGGVQLNGGTLDINHASALGSGALTIAAGTTLNNTSGAAITLSANNGQNWNGDFTFTGSNDLNLGTGSIALPSDRTVTVNGGNLTVGGLSGTGFSLTKAGSGTLIVGANSYTGNTTINGGTIRGTSASSFANTASVTVGTGATLDLGGINQTVSNISGSGTVQLNGAVLTTGTTANSTFAGALTGAGGLIKAGTGTFTLSGDKSGYTGNTTINAGVLDVGTVSGSFGNILNMSSGAVIQGSGSITRDIGSINNTTTPISAIAIVSSNGGFAARGGQLDVTLDDPTDAGTSFFGMAGSSNRFGNGLVLGSPTADSKVRILSSIGINNNNAQRTFNVNPGTGTATAEIVGIVSNGAAGGNNGINKQGAGDLILSNANTISGNTSINAGRIVLGNPLALQNAILSTNNAGNLVVTGYPTPTIGGLIGDPDVTPFIVGYSEITTLTLNPLAGLAPFFGGGITEGAAGMNLVKTGAGTQIFGSANSYTGSTSVLGGNLTLEDVGGLGSTTAPLIVGNPNTTVNGNAVVLNFPVGGSMTTGSLSGSIATLSGNLTGTNTATINNGGAGTDYTVNQTANGTYAGVIAGNGTFTLGAASTSTLTLTGANTYVGGTTISGGTLALGDGTATGSVVGDIVNNSALVLSPGASNLPLTGVISGSGTVTKSGANAVVLSAANTYAGGTTVSEGVLSVTNISGSATGTGEVAIGATGTLTGSGTISGAVTVSGILAPGNNVGTLTLGSSLSFTSGSTLAMDLGTVSDQLAFGSSATVSGSGQPTLALTLGDGFDYAASYTIVSNVATTGFTFSAITGYDSGNYTATVQKSGSNYVLTFPVVSASPTFASWATDNGITGEPANGDFDKDGVANAVEMVLGGNPATVSDTALLPTIAIVTNPADVPAGTYLEFTYRRTALSVSASVTAAGQYSTDLLTAWTTAADGVAGVEVIETANHYASGVDRVQVYVPKGANTRLFGRLSVTVPVAP